MIDEAARGEAIGLGMTVYSIAAQVTGEVVDIDGAAPFPIVIKTSWGEHFVCRASELTSVLPPDSLECDGALSLYLKLLAAEEQTEAQGRIALEKIRDVMDQAWTLLSASERAWLLQRKAAKLCEQMGVPCVHVLVHGATLCGLSPEQWGEGSKWVRRTDDRSSVTCLFCVRAANELDLRDAKAGATGTAGDHCEPGNECGRLGCKECQA